MDNELRHRSDGWSHKDHKYLRREWKNGRWVYYYDAPIGKNYKTAEMIELENRLNAESKQVAAYKKEQRQNHIDKTVAAISRYVDKGKKFLHNLDKLMHTRVVDLPIVIDLIKRGEFWDE